MISHQIITISHQIFLRFRTKFVTISHQIHTLISYDFTPNLVRNRNKFGAKLNENLDEIKWFGP